MNSDTKVKVKIGCLEYLTQEVEGLRKSNEILKIENKIINRFLNFAESIKPQNNCIGYGEDKLWQAKKEIEAAIKEVKTEQSELKCKE